MKRIKSNVPVIIPIVLYTGDKKWNSTTKLSKLMDKDVVNIVKEYIPEIQYLLIDKNRYSDEALTKMHDLISGLLYIENMEGSDIYEKFQVFLEIFLLGVKIEDRDILKQYFVALAKQKYKFDLNEEELFDQEDFKMINERLGIGREQIKQEEKLEVAKNMLKDGVSIKLISKYTGLKQSQILKLKK